MAQWKEVKKVSTSLMKYEDYQRPIKEAWVSEIVKKWNELEANPPKVSYRDGAYWVFDGQHTIAARLRRNGGKDLHVLCEVYHGLKKEDEAALFSRYNRNRKNVSRSEMAKADLISGDQRTTEVVRTIRNQGFDICFTKHNGGRQITAIGKVFQIWDKDGEKGLSYILKLIADTWGDDTNACNSAIIGGVAEFYRAFGSDPGFSRAKFIKKLGLVSPAIIIREGRELTVGGDKRFAKRILYHYNKGSRQNGPKLDVAKLD